MTKPSFFHLLLISALAAGCVTAGPELELQQAATHILPPGSDPSALASETHPAEPAPILESPAAPPASQPESRASETVAETVASEGLEIAPAERLEGALEAYESSRVFWQQGEFEDALAALDRAYELMASVEVSDESLLSQEKDDLRQLISRRVLEIYASRRTVVGGPNGEIPITVNAYVEREIRSFQGPERTFFLESYQRSGLYRPMILEALREAGMPEELSWLPLVESGFKVRALSSARALGLWQFIASTGYRYDLQRGDFIDERMDPEKATYAALAYLRDLHSLFGDWTTALAAYNCGENNVQRQIRRQSEGYFDQFWDLYEFLPRETRRYIPRMLATLEILRDPDKYGFDLPEPLTPHRTRTIQTTHSFALSDADRAMSLEKGTLVALNPELRHSATPPESYLLKVPASLESTQVASLGSLPRWASSSGLAVHRVRRGETLSGIARRYRTSVNALMRLNRISSANRIWPGQRLTVRAVPGAVPGGKVTPRAGDIRYSVRRGDSLWLLASRYSTTVDAIRSANGLRSNLLRPGQVLLIRGSGSATTASGSSYVVRRGDTLGKIARGMQVSLSQLLAANGLSRRSTIYPGQTLRAPLAN